MEKFYRYSVALTASSSIFLAVLFFIFLPKAMKVSWVRISILSCIALVTVATGLIGRYFEIAFQASDNVSFLKDPGIFIIPPTVITVLGYWNQARLAKKMGLTRKDSKTSLKSSNKI